MERLQPSGDSKHDPQTLESCLDPGGSVVRMGSIGMTGFAFAVCRVTGLALGSIA